MLTWADIALLAILGLSAIVGLWRGFVSEVMALTVWIAAFWLSIALGAQVGSMFENHVQAPTARWFLGYATVFIATLVLGGLLSWLIGKLVRGTGLSGTDRVLGLGFGLVRGAAVACVLVLALGFTPMPQEPAWRESMLLPGFERGAIWMRTWLPQAVAGRVSFDPIRAVLALPLPSGDNVAPAAASSAPAPSDPSIPHPADPAPER